MKPQGKKWLLAGMVPVVAVGIVFSTLFLTGLARSSNGECLGGDYIYYEQSHTYPVIYKNDGSDRIVVDEFVTDWVYDDRFILVFQWGGEKPAEQKGRYDRAVLQYENRYRLFRKQGRPGLWIIDKRDDAVYGPMSMTDYLEKRDSLGVPAKLRLKLKLEL